MDFIVVLANYAFNKLSIDFRSVRSDRSERSVKLTIAS
jgi:hypothetical protein